MSISRTSEAQRRVKNGVLQEEVMEEEWDIDTSIKNKKYQHMCWYFLFDMQSEVYHIGGLSYRGVFQKTNTQHVRLLGIISLAKYPNKLKYHIGGLSYRRFIIS